MWFKALTGFNEESPEQVRSNLVIEGDSFVSKINNKRFAFGALEVTTLDELRKKSNYNEVFQGKVQVEEIVADVQELHANTENENALFQAASQFNLLEMVGPEVTPEQGIAKYEYDRTQGPACAIACGAGTIYRNYFVKVGSQIGQTADQQIDCLDLIAQEFKNDEKHLWEMRNGYALVNQEGLLKINKIISTLNIEGREQLKGKLKLGIQWNTEVTKSASKHRVSQIYCSALPVAYSSIESIYWEYFARIILEATYEATFHAAVLNLSKYNSNKLYLTLVGGGAFGNEEHWILESLQKVLRKFQHIPLDVKVVSYGRSNGNLINALNEI